MPCQHKTLQLEPSPFASEAGFARASEQKRVDATRFSTKRQPLSKTELQNEKLLSASFPAPLVLPWDELNHDPDCEPQSFRAWLNLKQRNKPTKRRQTLYIAAAPEITKEMEYMNEWVQPLVQLDEEGNMSEAIRSPDVEDIIDYLRATYHNFTIKPFPTRLRFVPWESAPTTRQRPSKAESKQKQTVQKYIGLAHGNECTRIRLRPSPDGVFKYQLNLEDISDAAIAMLPSDAYSICLLTDHDIYENEDDDFCCGRAYGGSRVSVVQTARYNPLLDEKEKLDREHMWPASHCKTFIDGLCALEDVKPDSKSKRKTVQVVDGPIRAAIDAVLKIPIPSASQLSKEYFRALWFSRISRTVAHELGHCFGIAHCVYYACNMQGCSGMSEDVRQPPYLCPVCLSKVSYAAACELKGVVDEEGRKEYERERYEALLKLCGKWRAVGMFAGYEAWLEGRLGQ